jgi:hypothetical protein
MIADKKQRTVSKIWSDRDSIKALMPPAKSEFIDGEIVE